VEIQLEVEYAAKKEKVNKVSPIERISISHKLSSLVINITENTLFCPNFMHQPAARDEP